MTPDQDGQRPRRWHVVGRSDLVDGLDADPRRGGEQHHGKTTAAKASVFPCPNG